MRIYLNGLKTNKVKNPSNIQPEFLGMFFSSGVKIQRNLGVESNSKVVIHYTFFRVTLPAKKRKFANGLVLLQNKSINVLQSLTFPSLAYSGDV